MRVAGLIVAALLLTLAVMVGCEPERRGEHRRREERREDRGREERKEHSDARYSTDYRIGTPPYLLGDGGFTGMYRLPG
jgi:hypothetical protein